MSSRIAILLLLVLAGPLRSFGAAYMDLFPTVTITEFPRAGIPFTIEVNVVNEWVPLTYVEHVGATAVVLNFSLPPQFTLVSAQDAGWMISDYAHTVVGVPPIPITNSAGNIRCEVGNLPTRYRRPVYFTVMPTQVGTFNTTAQVTGQGGIDYPPHNNNLTTSIQVHSNGLAVVAGQSIPEQSGSNAMFQVRLAPPSSQTVTVEYTTVDGTASANEDYTPVSGVVVFPPGITNQTVLVPVLDDHLWEVPNQSFTLRLTNAVNAELSGLYEPNYVVDNEAPAQLSISNAPSVVEGYLATNLVFPIHLSCASDLPIVFNYATTGALSLNGIYTNPPYVTNATLEFRMVGNVTPESNRVLGVTLANAFMQVNQWAPVDLVQATAEGWVIDDDGAPGDFHHLEISTVPSPQIAGRPFPVFIYARDAFNNPATNYVSDAVEVDLYRIVNFSSTILQTIYVSNFVNGIGVAMMTSIFPQNRLMVVAWKPVGDWYTTASTAEFSAIASPPLFFSLTTQTATEGDGTLVGAGTVSITNVDFQDLVVQIDSSDPQELAATSVIIPAGQTSAMFNVTIVDDSRLDGRHLTTLYANSPGYIGASQSIMVSDNDAAGLTLVLPTELSEAKGLNTGVATLFSSRAPDIWTVLYLTSSNTSRLTMPGAIYFPAGQTSVTFTVTVPDNAVIDGPQTVAVSAYISDAAQTWATMLVHDNDTNVTLLTSLGNDFPAMENFGTRTNALMVKLGGVTSNDVTVYLTSSYPQKISLPASVTVPAGQLSVMTNITFIDDLIPEGDTNVTMTGTAVGFVSGTNVLKVYDNDVHHFVIGTIATNQTSGVPFTVSILAKDRNDVTMVFFRSNITLAATVGGVPLPLTPAVVSNVVRGSWNGPVTVNGWGTNVQLIVTGPGGAPQGSSNPFNVTAPWAANVRIEALQRQGSEVRIRFHTISNLNYQVEAKTNFTSATWLPVGTAIRATNSEMEIIEVVAARERFYRITVTP